jgi:hypothetical protein
MNDHAKANGRRLIIDDQAQAFAIFLSLHYGKQVWVPFPVIATFLQNLKPGCPR